MMTIPVTAQILFFLQTLMFLSVVFMHLSRKNKTLILLYGAQSLIISVALFGSSLEDFSVVLMGIALMTFVVKVILAPYFFFGLIRNHRMTFIVNTHLSAPLTLIVLAVLTAFSYSRLFQPLTILAPDNEKILLLAMAMILISIFLIINRKGVLSQMIGILSLENAIVSFAYVTGLEATPGPKIGILFDLLVWVIIASVFASMIYKHFGSLDVSGLNHLKEE